MQASAAPLLAEIRFLVGFLGEKTQSSWWGSNFMASSSEAFLAPVFSRTTMLAKYHGVCEAAMLVHDEHIGLGANYHLYRMPESAERAAAKAVTDTDFQQHINDVLGSSEAVQKRLGELAATDIEKVQGPVVLGNYADAELNQQLRQSASHYSRAFKEGYECFPFTREAE